MFDTMVITKAVAGLCATLLLFLVGKWVSETIYLPAEHSAEHASVVYPQLATADSHAAPAAEAAPVDVQALYANADAAAGATLFRNCRSCHSLEDGHNMTGPSLYGVVGRAVDTEAGFSYSGALTQAGDTWTVENLFHFLKDPRGVAPGTRMTFRGLASETDRINLIAYLATNPN